ncbi:Crp/Fnr family transcriptional regulator [uncultured Reyranella sp.]|uniref:Crp/Fnr family transcriptional regulator n=1 Tax=uncultured Reyranella sp. TaxID=735512 RepID=UPI0025EC0D07|nr:Crp/Fnr family transcriptional regulator [uncultured Reyranella sp.]
MFGAPQVASSWLVCYDCMVRNGAIPGRPLAFGALQPLKMPSSLPCDSCIGRTLNLCRPLDDVRLQHLLSLGGIRHWKRHETLFRAGDPIGAFFKIRKGIVAVAHTLDDGRRQITALRAPGDCVGYLDRDGRYAFEGQALTDVEACAFDRRKFDAYVAQHPDLAAALVEALSSALKQSGMLSLVLGQLRSTERVAHFLAEISALYAERHVSFAQPLTLHMGRNEIADYLGLTIETVSRSIGKLKSRNIIALVESGEVVILDFERLRDAGKVTG